MNKIKPGLILFLSLLSIQIFGQSGVLTKAAPAVVKVSEERLLRIDKLLQESISNKWITGATAFIARDGKIIYNKAFGVDDVAKNTPMQSDAIFRIASQTKAITSVGIMILFEEGKLLLDDPVSKYIPAFAKPSVLDQFNENDSTFTTTPAKREITIRDLLTHTSGIDYAVIGSPKMRAIYAKAGIPVGFESKNVLLDTEMNKLARLPLAHQPGERFTYGLSSDVLGYLIEVVSGKSLDAFFRERIFNPLGMNDTYFYLPDSKKSRLVTVYTEDKAHQLVKWESYRGIPASYPTSHGTYFSGGAGLSSTIKDYAVFLQMLLNKGVYNGQRILSRHSVDLMTMNQIGDLSISGSNKFGLGFEITTRQGQAKLGISEGSFSWGGFFGTTYWADPKEKLVCLLFLQQTPVSRGEIHDKFRALIYQALND